MNDQVEPAPSWTPAERWMWERARAGEVADFTTRDGASAAPRDPSRPAPWDNDRPRRTVRAATIIDILTRKPWTEALTASGLRIAGALLPDGLVLQHQRLSRPLWLEHCRIVGDLDLEETHIAGQFSLDGSCVTGATTISAMRVGYVSWKRTAFAGDVRAILARIQLNLIAEDARFGGKLDLGGSEIDGELALSRIEAGGTVNLGGAVVKGDVSLREATLKGDLHCDLLRARLFSTGQVSGAAAVRATTIAGQVWFGGAVLTSALVLGPLRSEFRGTASDAQAISGTRMQVGGWLWFWGVTASSPIDFSFSRIGGVDMRNPKGLLGQVQMHGTRVEGEFLLDHTTTWRADARLDLRNASIGSLQDSYPEDAWPRRIDLQGFHLDRLGGFGARKSSSFMDRPPEWFLSWLERTREWEPVGDNLWSLLPRWIRWFCPTYDRAPRALRLLLLPKTRNVGYRPSTYRMVATKLRELGRPTTANKIEFASREIERLNAVFPRSFGLWLLRVTIGYGIGGKYFWSLAWAGGLAVLCMIVGLADGHVDRPPSWWVFACIDHVLPIVSFEKEYGDTLPAKLGHWWSKAVFDGVTIISWSIGLMLAAGVAGLTQRAK